MTKVAPFIPILLNFDQSSVPLGYVDLSEERCVLKLNAKEKVTVADVSSGKAVFAPTYIITKEENGIVKEITLDSFSLLRQA